MNAIEAFMPNMNCVDRSISDDTPIRQNGQLGRLLPITINLINTAETYIAVAFVDPSNTC